jgi:hypothetical protein
MRKQLAGIPRHDMLHFIQHFKNNQVANGKKQFNTDKELANKYYSELGGSDKPNIIIQSLFYKLVKYKNIFYKLSQ